MPSLLLERLPLPSLRTYVSCSVVALGFAIFFANETVKAKIGSDPDAQFKTLPPDLVNLTLPYHSDEHFLNLMFVMRMETWCVWTLVNSCYCLLILFGKLVQNIVFGDLRVSERQHLKDKFWNFVFYKFIFVFGVLNVQSMEEVVMWVAWFSVLGSLHLLTLLARHRFEYMSFSPAATRVSQMKLATLLLGLLLASLCVLGLCAWVAAHHSLTLSAFLLAEALLLHVKCLYVVTRYGIQLFDMYQDSVWEARTVYVYYSELVFELMASAVEFAHYFHMLLYGNIFLSMASLVICMQLRFLFYELQRRIKRHKNYLRVVQDMEAKFPMATQEDLEHNADDCAICWEAMETARKLPCGHLFHNSCLRSWLEQDTSCPTCRTALSDPHDAHLGPTPRDDDAQPGMPNMADAAGANGNQGTTNHFFHFDGSRYVSWLPSFSVEVTHTNLLPGQHAAHAAPTSQLDNMAREVMQVFPHVAQPAVLADLQVTRSVDLTIDNILEGRLPQMSAVNSDIQITEPLIPSPPHSSPSLTFDSSVDSDSSQSSRTDTDFMEISPPSLPSSPTQSSSFSLTSSPSTSNATTSSSGDMADQEV